MTSIVELEAETRRVRVYAGGWSEFVAQREAGRERHESALRGLRLRARAARGTGAPDAAVGGARLRPGPQEEEVEGREEGPAKKLGRLERVEKPWTPWQLRLSLAPAARGGDVVARLPGRGRARRLPRRPGRPRAAPRRPARAARPQRRGQDDAPEGAARRAAARGGRAPARPRNRARRAAAGRRARSRARSGCSTASPPRAGSRPATRARCSRPSRSAPTTSSAPAARSHPANGAAPRSRSWQRAA